MKITKKEQLKQFILNSIKESFNVMETLEPGEKELPFLPSGELPDSVELYDLMKGKDYNLDLNSKHELAWNYAIKLSDDPLAGSLSPGKGFHSSLSALIKAPAEDELSPIEFDKVDLILDEWYILYPNESIEKAAFSLAKKIVKDLGIEWVNRKYWQDPIKEQISNPDRIKPYEKLLRTTGLSYRELLEDLLDSLDQNSYEHTLFLLKNKYGYSQ